jgi:hypothetical protein
LRSWKKLKKKEKGRGKRKRGIASLLTSCERRRGEDVRPRNSHRVGVGGIIRTEKQDET